MAVPESVVLTTFILPPDDGPLVELQKTLQFILEVANDLQLALASLQESNPLVNVLRVISQLRQALSKPGRALQAAYEHAVGCAKLYHEISRHMLTNRPQAEERIGLTLESVAVTLSGFRGASASINSATQDFRQSAERVKSVFDTMDLAPFEKMDGPRSCLLNAKSSNVVEDILQASLRAGQASKELGDYYAALKEHLERMLSDLDTLYPVPDEVKAASGFWTKHHEHCQRLAGDFKDVGICMSRAQPGALPWKSPFQSTSILLPKAYTRARTPFDPLSFPSVPIHNSR